MKFRVTSPPVPPAQTSAISIVVGAVALRYAADRRGFLVLNDLICKTFEAEIAELVAQRILIIIEEKK